SLILYHYLRAGMNKRKIASTMACGSRECRFDSRFVERRGLHGIGTVTLLLGLIALQLQTTHAQTTAIEVQHRAPILVSGVKEPEEMRVGPRPTTVPSDPEKMLAAETKSGAKMSDPAVLLPALNRVLARFPDYTDGYAMRAGLLCSGNDRTAILTDINN